MAKTSSQETAESHHLVVGNLVLNLDNFQAAVNRWPINLSYTEFELLVVLASAPDKVLSYEAIVERVWKESGHGNVRHLNVLVHRLRNKLADLKPFELRTVRGRGYGLVKRVRWTEQRDDA